MMCKAWSMVCGSLPFFAVLVLAVPGCTGSNQARNPRAGYLEHRVAQIQEARRRDTRRLEALKRQAAASAGWQKQVIEALQRQHRSLRRLRRRVSQLARLQRVRCVEAAERNARLGKKFSEVEAKVKGLRKKMAAAKSGYRRRKFRRTLDPLAEELERMQAAVDVNRALARACRPFVPRAPRTRPSARGSPPPAPPPPLPGVEPPSRPRPRPARPGRKPPPTGT